MALTFSSLATAYENMLRQFQDVLEVFDVGTIKTFPSSAWNAIKQPNPTESYLDIVLLLRRMNARKDDVDIVIHAKESYAALNGTWIVQKANVGVSYLKLSDEDDIGEVLHKVHFDCDSPVRKQHPKFHAQVSNDSDVVPTKALADLQFHWNLSSRGTSFKIGRIPTCEMTLPSVLVCLAADHCPPEAFSEFFESVVRQKSELPFVACDHLIKSVSDGGIGMRSHYWYETTTPHLQSDGTTPGSPR